MSTLMRILLLGLVIWGLWRLWSWLTAPPAKTGAQPDAPQVQDMTPCPACGTYILPGQQKNCGKSECPY